MRILSKFRLCRWMYQNGDIKTPHSLEEMSVDERIVNVHKKLSESIRQCPKTFFIWDTNIFYSFVKEIKYFASLNLINKDDVMHLKEELLQLLGVVEHLSIKESSAKTRKYLSICPISVSKPLTAISRNMITKSAYCGYILSIRWIRKAHISARCNAIGFNR